MGNSVCYQCPDRHAGCHATCEKGIAEEKRHEEERNKRYLENMTCGSVRIRQISIRNLKHKQRGRKV